MIVEIDVSPEKEARLRAALSSFHIPHLEDAIIMVLNIGLAYYEDKLASR